VGGGPLSGRGYAHSKKRSAKPFRPAREAPPRLDPVPAPRSGRRFTSRVSDRISRLTRSTRPAPRVYPPRPPGEAVPGEPVRSRRPGPSLRRTGAAVASAAAQAVSIPASGMAAGRRAVARVSGGARSALGVVATPVAAPIRAVRSRGAATPTATPSTRPTATPAVSRAVASPSSTRRAPTTAQAAGPDPGSRRSRPEERRKPTSAATRRNRIPVAVAGLFAVLVLVAGFPLSSLWTQHHQLSSEAAQLSRLTQENHRLSQQQQALNSKTEINRLARQDYQMVRPGQTLYDVLPGNGSAAAASTGDPADQPLVSPSDAPDMSPDPGLPQTPTAPASTVGSGSSPASASGHAAGAGASSSFWGRVANTLEFWQ